MPLLQNDLKIDSPRVNDRSLKKFSLDLSFGLTEASSPCLPRGGLPALNSNYIRNAIAKNYRA